MAKRRTLGEKTKEAVQSVKKSAEDVELKPLDNLVINWNEVISTGSTLLDLAISSGRIRGGGIPGGVLVEVYGRSGSGKTSVLSEVCGHAQSKGGRVQFEDPESRLDNEYARTYGVHIEKANYNQPNTVTELFEDFEKWDSPSDTINVFAADSLAALSTQLELEKGDKMGMRRAKEFSEGLRKNARRINNNADIMICSNQVRQGDFGDVTPGGKAVEFYASLRLSINQMKKLYKEKEYKWENSEGKKIKGTKQKRAFGIESKAIVTKSSLDVPYREVPIFIVFNYGIDDVRGNLQWMKDVLGLSKYKAVDKDYQRMDLAIDYIENNNLEEELHNEVIDLWEEVEKMFKHQRKKKTR